MKGYNSIESSSNYSIAIEEYLSALDEGAIKENNYWSLKGEYVEQLDESVFSLEVSVFNKQNYSKDNAFNYHYHSLIEAINDIDKKLASRLDHDLLKTKELLIEEGLFIEVTPLNKDWVSPVYYSSHYDTLISDGYVYRATRTISDGRSIKIKKDHLYEEYDDSIIEYKIDKKIPQAASFLRE